MKDNFFSAMDTVWQINIVDYIQGLQQHPIRFVTAIIDIAIVIYLAYQLIKITKKSRVWQLLKGILLIVIVLSFLFS